MSVRLPIDPEGARFTFGVELEGVSYTIGFRWNDRDGAWYMEVGDGQGTPLVVGVKVVINTMLLGRRTTAGLPTGDFLAIDTGGGNIDAAFEDLGRRVQVAYFTRAEVLEALGG